MCLLPPKTMFGNWTILILNAVPSYPAVIMPGSSLDWVQPEHYLVTKINCAVFSLVFRLSCTINGSDLTYAQS